MTKQRRHTEEDIMAFGKEDIDTLLAILGENEYLFGSQSCSFGATVHAFVANLLVAAAY